jgi:ATP-dependent Zn protease
VVHEAGHALLAYLVGWRFEYVTIERDPRYPDLHGHVRYRERLEERLRGRDEVIAWAVAFSGGRFGELALLGDTGPGPANDDRLIIQVMTSTWPDLAERAAAAREVAGQAQLLVVNHRSALAAVTDALLRERRLTEDQVGQLIEAHQTDQVRPE